MTPLLIFSGKQQACSARSPRTLERLRCAGGGPLFIRLRGSVRYRLEDLQSWIASRVFANTSEKEAQR